MHDIGHSPLSHTFEHFFERCLVFDDHDDTIKFEKTSTLLLEEAKQAYSNDLYNLFLEDYGEGEKPHERMSAIIVLKRKELTSNFGKSVDMDFLIRSIIGCTYRRNNITKHIIKNNIKTEEIDDEKIYEEFEIKNCLIRLLNSKMIDVDKLDYIERDSMFTGFKSITIDIDRVLSSLTAIKRNDGQYESNPTIWPAFRKNALNIIDNVLLANNAFNQLYNHHSVLYERSLFLMALGEISKQLCEPSKGKKEKLIDKKNKRIIETKDPDVLLCGIFSVESILGSVQCNGFRANLISDDDIWFLMKSFKEIPAVKELLCRSNRRKFLWKTPAEFYSIIDDYCIDGKKLIDSISENNKHGATKKIFPLNSSEENSLQQLFAIQVNKNEKEIDSEKIFFSFNDLNGVKHKTLKSLWDLGAKVKINEKPNQNSNQNPISMLYYLVYSCDLGSDDQSKSRDNALSWMKKHFEKQETPL